MITIPRQVEYALMALKVMDEGQPGQVFAVSGLCETYQVPFDVMSRTLQRMSKAGILRSVKGIRGGYQLIRNTQEITLLDLMETVMRSVSAVLCQDTPGGCPLTSGCQMRSPMAQVNRRLRDMYRSITVRELITGIVDAGTAALSPAGGAAAAAVRNKTGQSGIQVIPAVDIARAPRRARAG